MQFMKNRLWKPFRKMSTSLFFLLAGGMFFLSSCEKEDISGPLVAKAPPVITHVRSTNAAKPDSTFTQSTLGTTIVIVGQNLAATQTVTFNGRNAPVNSVFATDTHLIIRIPDTTPTVATVADPTQVPNELKVINSAGEATYTFRVLPPAPTVAAISNEFAKAGQQITIFGDYFYLVKSVNFPGNVAVTTGITSAADGKSLTVTVPQGVNASQGDVRVVTESGTSAVNRRTKVYNNVGMMLNWEERNADGGYIGFGWGLDPSKAVVTTAPGITAIDGRFGLISQAVPGNWGWNNDKVVSMSNWSTNRLIPATPATMFADNLPIANFDLKLEMAATTNVEGLSLLVWIPGTPAGTVERLVPLNNFIRSTDGKWYTVSVPLNDLAGPGNARLSTYGQLNKNEIRLVIQNTTSADRVSNIGIDNIRIENMVVRQ
jgi:hypothetical protein